MLFKNILKHTKLVFRHKWVVFKLCCKIGIPWRGFMHDWSKFSPTEFGESVKYYVGTHSPIKEARIDKGYSYAWVHHVSKNKHHYQYWIDFTANGPVPVIIPYKYVAEMICDKLAAGIIYQGKNWTNDHQLNYYLKERQDGLIHTAIDAILLEVFTEVKDNGIDKTLTKKNIKSLYKKHCSKYLNENLR